MTLTRSQWTLGALLAATLAAVAWVSSGDSTSDTVVAARDARSASAAPSSSNRRRAANDDQVVASGVEPSRLIRVLAERRVGDPFGAVSFLPPVPPPKPAITVAAPPPPPPPAPVAPRAPSAPPFPWTFMGRMIEDPQNPAVFLAKADRLTVAHLGDTLENVWRINGMDAKGLRVEYLPLKSSATVNLASGSDSSGPAGGPAGNSALQQQQQFQQQIQQVQSAPVEATETRPAQTAAPAQPAVSGIEVSSTIGTPLNDH